jgi:hypothetical protein
MAITNATDPESSAPGAQIQAESNFLALLI